MKVQLSLAFSICMLLCTSCNKDLNQENLRSDYSRSEFKSAIIGDWQSVFLSEGHVNVIYLKFNRLGKAKISLQDEDTVEDFKGDYHIAFMRDPSPGTVTLAEITIESTQRTIVLSRVCFDLNNIYPTPSGLHLRILESPYGTLSRSK